MIVNYDVDVQIYVTLRPTVVFSQSLVQFNLVVFALLFFRFRSVSLLNDCGFTNDHFGVVLRIGFDRAGHGICKVCKLYHIHVVVVERKFSLPVPR